LEQQILRQARDLKEAENTAKNLSAALAGLNVEAGETTEKVSILAEQLEKASLSLILLKKEKAIRTLSNQCIIYRLIISQIRSHVTQIIKITY
jgi:uncharacterized coiled-coil protein SlyX